MNDVREPEVLPPGQQTQAAMVLQQQVTGMVRPMGSIADLEEAYRQFVQFKESFLAKVKGGVIEIGYGKNKKPYVAKPGWVAAKTFFRIDTEVLREKWETLPDGVIQYACVVRARAKNGDFADAVGICDTGEDFYRKGTRLKDGEQVPEGVKAYAVRGEIWENGKPTGNYEWRKYLPKALSAVVGFAQTRAQNRAISTLCGGGENSAEEMTSSEDGGGGTGDGGHGNAGGAPKADGPPKTMKNGKPWPTWWRVGDKMLDAAKKPVTGVVSDKDGAPVDAEGILHWGPDEPMMSGSKAKQWPTLEGSSFGVLTCYEMLQAATKARLAGKPTNATDPVRFLLMTGGKGAYKGKANWPGETAVALDHAADALVEAQKAKGGAPVAAPAAAAPATPTPAAAPAPATAAPSWKTGDPIPADHNDEDPHCLCLMCIPF
jgi:hypothetical protein